MTRRKDGPPEDAGDEAASRRAKGSVHEAIGKLIGDDAACRQGAEQKAATARKPPQA